MSWNLEPRSFSLFELVNTYDELKGATNSCPSFWYLLHFSLSWPCDSCNQQNVAEIILYSFRGETLKTCSFCLNAWNTSFVPSPMKQSCRWKLRYLGWQSSWAPRQKQHKLVVLWVSPPGCSSLTVPRWLQPQPTSLRNNQTLLAMFIGQLFNPLCLNFSHF